MYINIGKWELATGRDAKIPRTSPEGATGTNIMSGIINEEYQRKWIGSTRWRTIRRMRSSDGQMQAVLLVVELPLRSADWTVIPASDDKRDHDVAEHVRLSLFKRMDEPWDDWLRQACEFMTWGCMPFEKIYKIEDGKVWIRKLGARLPETIRKWNVNPDTEALESIMQQVLKSGSYQDITIPREDLLLFVHRRTGSNYEGISILRPAYKHWYMTDQLYKIAAVGFEKNATGFPIYTLSETGQDGDATAAEEQIKKIRASEEGGFVLNPGETMDMKEGKFRGVDILQHIRHHDSKIARSVLAWFMQLGQEGAGGAYALSKDATDFFLMSEEAQGKLIASEVNRNLIPQLVDYNFPNVKEYPELQMGSLSQIDTAALGKVLKDLVDGTFISPGPDDETYLRAELGLPEKAETTPAKVKERHGGHVHLQEGSFWRDLTDNEDRLTLKDVERTFDKKSAEFVRRMETVRQDQIERFVGKVKDAIEENVPLAKLTVPLVGKYEDEMKSQLTGGVEEGVKQVKRELKYTKDIPMDPNVERWINTQSATLAQLHTEKLKSSVLLSSTSRLKMQEPTWDDIIRTMEEESARELAKTASYTVPESINTGRKMAAVAIGTVMAVWAQYSGILDRRICPFCESLDGLQVRITSPHYTAYQPPMHGSGRCIWVHTLRPLKQIWQPPDPLEEEKYRQLH